MLTTTILATTFTALAAALPTSNLESRAGGPEIVPIPCTCTVTTLSPPEGFQPAPSTDDAVFYSAYYPSPTSNKTKLQEQCLQQCYGYGDSTKCKAAFWAEHMEVPKGYYGSPGGTYNTGCLFFNRTLEPTDFVEAPAGKTIAPYAANLQC